mmetsp:Transcript_33073/g.24345  ORF Transcript_33073/g.24345 Transcript_33073/m.24345 type:complete len:80 (+) Transcript_33073:213-452(+)
MNEDNPCPSQYNSLHSNYLGIETFCILRFSSFHIKDYYNGGCGDKSDITVNIDVEGPLYIFDGKKLCYKHGGMNYLSIY